MKAILLSAFLFAAFAVPVFSGNYDNETMPPDLVYPFGSDVGDSSVTREGSGFSEVNLTGVFLFYKTEFGQIYVSLKEYFCLLHIFVRTLFINSAYFTQYVDLII